MVHKVAIIGSGRRGTSLIKLFNKEENIEVVGVAEIEDTTPSSIKTEERCLAKAKKNKIPVTFNYIKLIKRKDINIVADVTRSKNLHKKISQDAAQGVEIIEGESARLFWQLVRKQEERREINGELVQEKEKFLKKKLDILSEINTDINVSMDLDSILDRILEAATDEIGFEFATIQLIDEKRNLIWTEKGRKNSTIKGALDPTMWVGLKHQLTFFSDKKRDVHAWVLMEEKKEKVIKGWDDHFDKEIYGKFHHEKLIRAFVPIITKTYENELIKIGTLETGHNINRKDTIDNTELEMLKALANQAAIAIQHARLYSQTDEALQKKVKELKTLYDIGTKITSQINLKNVFDSIIKHTLKIFAEDINLAIFLCDEKTKKLVLQSDHRIKNAPNLEPNFTIPFEGENGKSLIAKCYRKKVQIHEKNVTENTLYLELTKNINSELDIPLIYENEVIGVLNAESEKKDGFNKEMIKLLTYYAQQAAIAIKNAQLLKQYENTNEKLNKVLRILSHQLGRLPSNLRMASGELMSKNILPRTRHKMIEIIHYETFWACQGLNNIDTWYRLQSGEKITPEPKEYFYLKDEIDKISDSLIRIKKEKNITINNELPDNFPPIFTNSHYANLIFANILGNAIKYSDQNGKVLVIGDKDTATGKLCISIEDDGIGIPEKEKEKILEEFKRGTNVPKEIGGSGLGCYIISKLCEVLGWELKIKSPVFSNRGTRFSVYIHHDTQKG